MPMVLLQALQTNLREGNILQNAAKHLPHVGFSIQSLPAQLRRAQLLGNIFQHKAVALDCRLAHLRGKYVVGNKRQGPRIMAHGEHTQRCRAILVRHKIQRRAVMSHGLPAHRRRFQLLGNIIEGKSPVANGPEA